MGKDLVKICRVKERVGEVGRLERTLYATTGTYIHTYICERFLNLCDRYAGALLLRHLYIMTQSLNLSFWLMSSHPNVFSPSEMLSYFLKPRTILVAKF